jgi:hypothetical protein
MRVIAAIGTKLGRRTWSGKHSNTRSRHEGPAAATRHDDGLDPIPQQSLVEGGHIGLQNDPQPRS